MDSSLANRILQLAINRDPKSISISNTLNGVPATQKPPTLSPIEVEQTKKQLDKELQSYNNDLRLLSSLLGRPITSKDLPNLTKQLAPAPKPTTTSTTTPRTTSTTTTRRTPSVDQLALQQLLLRQQQQHNSSPAVAESAESTELYGKTNEAILATVLKQRGIGPANTNANLEEILAKISPRTNGNGATDQATVQPIITTARPRPRTARPPEPPPPLRSSRPILDGLSWLWREWQATAPQPRQRPAGYSSVGGAPPSSTFGLSGGLGGGGGGGAGRPQLQAFRDEGLDPDAVSFLLA